MKNKIKWKPLFVAILVVIGISLIVFLYCKGFRITYAPDLETSWDAVSAFAAWGGVIMSFGAVMVAGIVAWRQNEISREQTKISRKQADIADKQNRIALFEKRMECYSTIQNIFAFARQISELESKKGIQTAFKLYFGEADSFSENQNYTWYTITIKRQESIIVGGLFLFPEYNEEELQNLLMDIIELSGFVAVKTKEEAEQPISDKAQSCKERICSTCSNLETTLIPLMEKELQLCMR